jgi:hypothetical protein
MGIRSLEHYIQKVDDEDLKKNFQSMQQEVKLVAQKLAERIQNLGGIDGLPIWGGLSIPGGKCPRAVTGTNSGTNSGTTSCTNNATICTTIKGNRFLVFLYRFAVYSSFGSLCLCMLLGILFV